MNEHTQKLAIELEKRVTRQRVAHDDPTDRHRAQDLSAQTKTTTIAAPSGTNTDRPLVGDSVWTVHRRARVVRPEVYR